MAETTKDEQHAAIEVDENPTLVDDGYESGGTQFSDTTSITSTIKQYIKENGRTYHRYQEGKYLSPNDEAERDRLDFYHAVQMGIWNQRLFLAPIEPHPHRILDCGTGTGTWALDMGHQFPSAEVIGVDLSPIQPTWVNTNVRFEIDDLDQEWTFPQNHFDFIHSRQIFSGIRNMPRFFSQMFEHTKPGGWFEFAESGFSLHSDDGTLTKESKMGYWFEKFLECAEKAGLKLPEPEDIVQLAESAGFVDVEIKKIKQPWGAWPKDKRLKKVGRMVATGADALESYALALFTRHGGLTEEEGKTICHEAVVECRTTTHVHAYNWLWHVYGRKPGVEVAAR